MNPTTQDIFTTLLDGREIEVTHLDGSTEKVRVRKVPIRSLTELAAAWGRPEKEVAVYAARDDAWVEIITDESFAAVMDAGRELNMVPFGRWFRWQQQSLEALNLKMPTAPALPM